MRRQAMDTLADRLTLPRKRANAAISPQPQTRRQAQRRRWQVTRPDVDRLGQHGVDLDEQRLRKLEELAVAGLLEEHRQLLPVILDQLGEGGSQLLEHVLVDLAAAGLGLLRIGLPPLLRQGA